MSDKLDAVLEHDDGARAQDLFRRAAFNWALSTKKLAEASAVLTPTQRVAPTALADIRWAKDLLGGLFMPEPTSGIGYTITTKEIVQETAALLRRAAVPPLVPMQVAKETAADVYLEAAAEEVREQWARKKKSKAPLDLSAPVHSKDGKMLWADINCSDCPSKATERCRKEDGGFREKPHAGRIVMAEKA